MALIDAAMRTIHLLGGGILTGSVVFFAWTVTRSSGSTFSSAAVGELASALTTISRGCAVLLLVSGGYMAAMLGSELRGTAGMLVGAMIVLWLIVTALVEVGNSRLDGGASLSDVDQFYLVAAVASLLLLVDAGYVSIL